MEEKLELNDIADNLLIINQETIERLFQEENKDTLVLYMFYYKTAKWQKHNSIKATDDYTMKCLHWGIHRVKNIKKRLKEMELIEVEKRINNKQQIDGWYIRVNYFNSSSTVSSSTVSPLVEEQDHKILLNNNLLNTNNNNKYICEFEELWKLYPKKVGKKDALRHYIRNRKNKVSYETILTGLNNYNEYIENQKTPNKYIKDGSTWFNQESWNDERAIEHKETEEEWLSRMEREIEENEHKRY